MVKMNLKHLGPPFPTTPLIEVHSYGNERIWNKIAPINRDPTYRSCTVYYPETIGVDLGGQGGDHPPRKIVRGESIFSPPQE